MAEGSKIGFQGNVPLDGESNIVQTVAGLASDVLTLTGAAGQTGDFFVCQTSAGTEKFVITSAGAVTVAGPLGFNGATATGTEASLAALSTVSGAFGASSSAAYLLLVAMVQLCHDRLVDVGLLA